VDQALLDVDQGAGAALVADLLAAHEQEVVEDDVVAEARGSVVAHVDQVEGPELEVEAQGPGRAPLRKVNRRIWPPRTWPPRDGLVRRCSIDGTGNARKQAKLCFLSLLGGRC
jgi:hypothetical protein